MEDDLNKIQHHANQINENLKEADPSIKNHLAKIKNTSQELKSSADSLYNERNKMVFQRFRIYHSLGVEVAYKDDELLEEEEWFVWYVPEQQHDEFGSIQQMGWHIHKDDLNPARAPFMQKQDSEYDGHTTEEKLERMSELDRKIIEEFRNEYIREGERYMKSALGNKWYRVTKWRNVEGEKNKHIAEEKEPVQPDKVPEEVREAMEE